MEKNSKIYIAGHDGMVGSAILRNLKKRGYKNFVFTPYPEYDLTNQQQTIEFFLKEKPDYVFDAAAKVGGILANDTYRAQFIYENLMIQNNIIHSAHKYGVKKLLFLGSSCIYPRDCPQPMKEEYLLTGELEKTNEPYAIAKIAGIKMCENYYKQYGSDFFSVMPTNLYGPNDNFDLETSHVLPALIRKFHLAKCLEKNDWDALRKDLNKLPINGVTGKTEENKILEILNKQGIQVITPSHPLATSPPCTIVLNLWGTGKVYREFLYVDDMVDACVHIMENVSSEKLYDELKQTHINIGTGEDLTIKELAEMIKNIVGFKGKIEWDNSKPDGTPQKLLNVDRLHKLGWKHKYPLEDGIKKDYISYKNNFAK